MTEIAAGHIFSAYSSHLSSPKPSCTTASMPLPLSTFHGESYAFDEYACMWVKSVSVVNPLP